MLTTLHTAKPLCINHVQELAVEELLRLDGRASMPRNLVDSVHINGALNIEALAAAATALVRRHTVLSTAFRPNDELPAAIRRLQLSNFRRTGVCAPFLFGQTLEPIGGDIPISVDKIDESASIQGRILQDAMFSEARRSFDYRIPPLFRLRVITLERDLHAVIMAVPNLAADVPSLALLWRDLFLEYEIAMGASDVSITTPTQFWEFAKWQSAQLSTTYFSSAEEHWQDHWNRLGSTQLASYDLDFLDTPSLDTVSKCCFGYRQLDADLCRAVHECAVAHEVAPYVVFLAAFATFLSRASGKNTLAWWIPLPNRLRDEAELTVGYLTNSHLVGLSISPSMRRDGGLIEACRRLAVDAQTHGDMPLPLLWWRTRRRPVMRNMPVTFDWASHGQRLHGQDLVVDHRTGPIGDALVQPGFYLKVVEESQGAFSACVVYWSREWNQSAIEDALERYCDSVASVASTTSTLPQ